MGDPVTKPNGALICVSLRVIAEEKSENHCDFDIAPKASPDFLTRKTYFLYYLL